MKNPAATSSRSSLHILAARWLRSILLILLAVALTGCGREDLYTNVTESDANTMLGLLIARGISATKRPVKENLYAVAVPRDQFASAVDILKWYGIPKETFSGIGEMFPKTGLVSSPSEERIRFMYALAGNISRDAQQHRRRHHRSRHSGAAKQ
jgi:type III secretion protein J